MLERLHRLKRHHRILASALVSMGWTLLGAALTAAIVHLRAAAPPPPALASGNGSGI